MSEIDVSVVLSAHDQTLVCGPTVTSVDRAVAAAEAAGHTVEKIVALDHPSERTIGYFDAGEFGHWGRLIIDGTDESRSYEAVLLATRGQYLTFVRGGDLLSENWLTRALTALERAREQGERVIGHPEIAIDFDGEVSLHHYVDQDSELFTPYLLYAGGAFDALCLAPREAYLELGTPDRATMSAHAVALDVHDDRSTVASMTRGWRHTVVRETAVFRRRRDAVRPPRSLPSLGIDQVRGLAAALDQ